MNESVHSLDMPLGVSIAPARNDDDLRAAEALFREYQDWLDAPVCFQDFETEIGSLATVYAPPRGELWLARYRDQCIGVVGMKPIADTFMSRICEMKRLYVRDSWRERGLGRRMAELCITWARETGYASVCLETLERLSSARSLYRSMGFTEQRHVVDKSLETPIFMELRLH